MVIPVQEGNAEVRSEQLLGESQDDDRQPRAPPQNGERMGSEPVQDRRAIQLVVILIAHDPAPDNDQIEGDTDEEQLLDRFVPDAIDKGKRE